MTVNDLLLEDTMAHIRLYPELHNQQFFFEKTEFGLAACFAGRACLLANETPTFFNGRIGAAVLGPNGSRHSAWRVARTLLGIDTTWASCLFSPANTRQMLQLKVKDLLNGASPNFYGELINA